MGEMFKPDMVITILIIFTVVSSAFALYRVNKYRDVLANYRGQFLKLFLYGLGLLLFALLGNSIAAKKWDIDFLVAFLTARETGEWFFRYLLPFAYMGIVIGGGALIVLKKK